MRFCSLGSGSEGNALIVEASNGISTTRVMMDCGFGLAETESRLARCGLSPTDLDAIVVTHEHSDHLGGVARFARKHAIPVWLTHGTARLLSERALPPVLMHYVDPHESFSVGDIMVTPFTVPHDANEPVQYVFSDGAYRLGVLTDVGVTTPHIEASLTNCDALVLEANHDADMLRLGPYPASLKQRVAGRFGHLDNLTAANLLARIRSTKLQHILAAHLSKQNNTEALAAEAFANALNCASNWIGIARQDDGFDWREFQ
ncbi:MAG: MBL fold metallo-hydrolase [Gammaproteobacteria bacterium]|nr:MBL fold metallo-hydrolase [Gammaproteobacteria bacterium]